MMRPNRICQGCRHLRTFREHTGKIHSKEFLVCGIDAHEASWDDSMGTLWTLIEVRYTEALEKVFKTCPSEEGPTPRYSIVDQDEKTIVVTTSREEAAQRAVQLAYQLGTHLRILDHQENTDIAVYPDDEIGDVASMLPLRAHREFEAGTRAFYRPGE